MIRFSYFDKIVDCFWNSVDRSGQIGHLMPGFALFMDDDQSRNLFNKNKFKEWFFVKSRNSKNSFDKWNRFSCVSYF